MKQAKILQSSDHNPAWVCAEGESKNTVKRLTVASGEYFLKKKKIIELLKN